MNRCIRCANEAADAKSSDPMHHASAVPTWLQMHGMVWTSHAGGSKTRASYNDDDDHACFSCSGGCMDLDVMTYVRLIHVPRSASMMATCITLAMHLIAASFPRRVVTSWAAMMPIHTESQYLLLIVSFRRRYLGAGGSMHTVFFGVLPALARLPLPLPSDDPEWGFGFGVGFGTNLMANGLTFFGVGPAAVTGFLTMPTMAASAAALHCRLISDSQLRIRSVTWAEMAACMTHMHKHRCTTHICAEYDGGTTIRYTTLRCTALNCNTLQYIALQYATYMSNVCA